VNNIEIARDSLGALTARAERYVGTLGGGMDQAVALGAVEGHACRVDFDPLALTPVPVPTDWRFVVASSLVPAEKSGAAQQAYNLRTVECGEALKAIGAAMGFTATLVSHPGPVDATGESGDSAAREPETGRTSTSSAASSSLTYEGLLTRAPVAELLEAAHAALSPTLLRRFRHVVTEAERVTAAEEAMRRGDLATMGGLMSASHSSLRDDYEVSSAELDRLVAIAGDAGATGARLTGAGFGGCVVALTDARGVDHVLEDLGARFFQPAGFGRAQGEHLFVAQPSGGASVAAL
jgi:galactokinase